MELWTSYFRLLAWNDVGLLHFFTTHIISSTTLLSVLHQDDENEKGDIFSLLKVGESYIKETSRNLNACIYKHKRGLYWEDPLISLVIERNKIGHNFDFRNTIIVKKEDNS